MVRTSLARTAGYIGALAAFMTVATGLLAFQRELFQDFDVNERANALGQTKTEWAFARLRYSGQMTSRRSGFGSGSRWATDYPKADRQYVLGVQRLTRLSARSIEQVVSPDEDELYNWPWLYAVEVGSWTFTPTQAARMREHLLKGGFLMADDFHGAREWNAFMVGIRAIFPDRQVEELQDSDEIFHVLYDLE